MSDQGIEYAAFVAERLKVERERSTRLGVGASAATATSAGVVTLLIAIVALVVGKDFAIEGPARILVVLALVLLGTASVLGVTSGLLRTYKVPAKETLEDCLDSRWADSAVTARLTVAWLDFDTLLTLRTVNNAKSWWLDLALKVRLARWSNRH